MGTESVMFVFCKFNRANENTHVTNYSVASDFLSAQFLSLILSVFGDFARACQGYKIYFRQQLEIGWTLYCMVLLGYYLIQQQ